MAEITDIDFGGVKSGAKLDHSAAQMDSAISRALPGGELDNLIQSRMGKRLLINDYFSAPYLVNQRGQSSYTSAVALNTYTIDGWYINTLSGSQTNTVVALSGGAVNSITLGNQYGQFLQSLENATLYRGKTITISLEVSSATGGIPYLLINDGVVQSGVTIDGPGTFSVTQTISASASSIYVGLQNNSASEDSVITPVRFKPELGSISTLAYDTPPTQAEQELNRQACKRYYRLWKTSDARTAALNEVGLMRIDAPTTGTIDIGGTTYYYASAEL